MAKKTTAPITRAQFREKAPSIVIKIAAPGMPEQEYTLSPREFETGSLGWNLSDKMRVKIDGVDVAVQIGLNLIVVGSKDLPKDAAPSTAQSTTTTPPAETEDQ